MIAEFAAYRDRLHATLDLVSAEQVDGFIELLESAYRDERQVLLMGNGGSGATASHAACDLNKGVCHGLDKRFRVLCLNDNVPTLLAYANDVAYDRVFVEPLRNFLRPRDLVVGISCSGNSRNVVQAIEYANAHEAHTVGLSAFDGGRLRALAHTSVWVPVRDMQLAEDVHMAIFHVATQALMRRVQRTRAAGQTC